MTQAPHILVAAALIALPGAARAACTPVSGTIEVSLVSSGCTSAIGLCTEGEISGAGQISGDTSYTAADLAASAVPDASEAGWVYSYAGTLTITTRNGTLTVTDVGILDYTTMTFTEIGRITGGTGKLAGATGVLYFSGDVTGGGTGFSGDVSGEVCVE